MILNIENGTFDPLQGLEVIRLSHNGLDRIPSEILQLPNIRKIFLDNNRLVSGGGFGGVPASETLESLNLAYCYLQELPRLEGYLNLQELNVSGNNLKRILPQQLAPMCQLHWLDLSGNPKLSDGYSGDGCDCHLLVSWIAQRNIILQNGYRLNCTSNRRGKAFIHRILFSGSVQWNRLNSYIEVWFLLYIFKNTALL
jgi:Leucine-rich repeat (LRR) protein